MNDININPLIKEAVHMHSGDERIERVILDMLQETLLEQNYPGRNSKNRFDKNFRNSILHHFKEELDDE